MGFLAAAVTPQYDAAKGLPGFGAGVNAGDLQNAQNLTQNQFQQQQNFLNAITPNGGLNANQAGIFGQQQGLANQFQQMANGQGPNPAQAQLAQNTGQNIAQQAALMGGARGAQSNPGLMARQAGQVGGNIQQQAVGQAATLGAQQQIAGMQGLGQQQGQMANLATAGVGQQQGAIAARTQQQENYQAMIANTLTQQNAQQVQAQGANVPLYQQAMKGSQGILGGVLGGIGGALGLASGGQIAGPVNTNTNPAQIQQAGPKSFLGRAQSALSGVNSAMNSSNPQDEDPIVKGMTQLGTGLGKMVRGAPETPGLPQVSGGLGSTDLAGGLNIAAMASQGGSVRGKASVQGDSQKNDTVSAMLSPGEVVIPRSHVGDPEKAAEFLNHLMGWNLKAGKKA